MVNSVQRRQMTFSTTIVHANMSEANRTFDEKGLQTCV